MTSNTWIDVREQLPERNGYYLVATHGGDGDLYVDFFYYCGDGRLDCEDFSDIEGRANVTHWMPLPPAPTSESENRNTDLFFEMLNEK